MALSSGKFDTYEYITGEEILPPDQRRVIKQTKFSYFPLVKAIEQQIKIIEDQESNQINQIKALEGPGKQLVKCNASEEKEQKSKRLDKQKEILYNMVAEKNIKLHLIQNMEIDQNSKP